MTTYSLGLSIEIPPDIPLNSTAFPVLSETVQAVAESAHKQWLAYAQGEPLPDGKVINSRSGTYHRSIKLEQLTPFHYRIISRLPYAESIETGMPARDLKKMLDSSTKVRRSKDGKRYLIIPFRWGTPGATGFGKNVMPESVHNFWKPKTVARSQVIRMGQRPSGTGAYDIKTRKPLMVPQRQYKWGTRLTQSDLNARGINTEFNGKKYKTHPMAGMVNFRKSGASGGASHSNYLTFRVMSEGSSGWKAPAVPGKYPAKVVSEKIKSIADRAFRKAIEEDVRNYLNNS